MENELPHMVEQVLKYSDGTETVIKYRGVVENGILTPDNLEDGVSDSPIKKVVKRIRKRIIKS